MIMNTNGTRMDTKWIRKNSYQNIFVEFHYPIIRSTINESHILAFLLMD